MVRMNHLLLKLTIRARNLGQNVKGQDLIEYALMAGFVAVAAGALMPNIASSISTVFSKISSVMADAAAS
jgi:pilus assembly protein Flp/PilA